MTFAFRNLELPVHNGNFENFPVRGPKRLGNTTVENCNLIVLSCNLCFMSRLFSL